jgi:hypothetical protein
MGIAAAVSRLCYGLAIRSAAPRPCPTGSLRVIMNGVACDRLATPVSRSILSTSGSGLPGRMFTTLGAAASLDLPQTRIVAGMLLRRRASAAGQCRAEPTPSIEQVDCQEILVLARWGGPK